MSEALGLRSLPKPRFAVIKSCNEASFKAAKVQKTSKSEMQLKVCPELHRILFDSTENPFKVQRLVGIERKAEPMVKISAHVCSALPHARKFKVSTGIND